MIINFFLATIAFALNWVLYLVLPKRIPLHFNAAGRPDRWGSSLEHFLINAGLILFMLLLYVLVPRIDPKRRNLWGSRGYHLIFTVIWLVPIMVALMPFFYLKGFSINKSVMVVFGLLFIGMGNYLPTLKPNYFVGIRTPWTLENEEVWRKTHRIGGWIFIITGLLLFPAVLFPEKIVIPYFLALLLGAATFLLIYSYVYWRKIIKKSR